MNTTNKNRYVRIGYAVVLATLIALALAAPTFAAGAVGFGK